MAKKLNISFDSDLLESISAEFDLRAPNKAALRKLVFTLDGEYNPDVMQVMNLATGVGKTYLMAAFIEYLRCQGIQNVVIVTPGKTVQAKTVANFTPGNQRYIDGTQVPPDIVTPQDYSAWIARTNGQGNMAYGHDVPILAFIFNIQQLIAPKSLYGETHGNTQAAQQRKPRRFDENAGVLFDYLKELDDLVVIADESHLYSASATAFNSALRELDPAATVGLTASTLPDDNVIYTYPLYKAIEDKYVKAPVLAFRKGGYGADQASEEQQLRDALQLRNIKQAYYDAYTKQQGTPHLNAVVFIICSDTDHASQVADLLRTPEYLGNERSVLQVDSKHDDDGTQRLLEGLDAPDSPVLAVVSVNKLKEGWDVKNIAVIVTLRAMASEVLTEQTMGRGLRLPFGKYTDVWQIDQLDIISHQSFRELLEAENVLNQFGLEDAVAQADKNKVANAIRNAIQNKGGNITSGLGTQAHDGDTCKPGEQMGYNNSLNQDGKNSNGKQTKPDSQQQSALGGIGNGPSTLGAMEIGEDGFGDGEPITLEYITIKRNPKFADVAYKFPVTEVTLEQQPINLADIGNKAIMEAAQRVTSTGDVILRKEIVAVLGKKLSAIDTESAEVESVHVGTEDAENALIKLVMNMQLIPSTQAVAKYVSNYLVPKFMKGVNFDNWTVKSLSSAQVQLRALLKEYIDSVQRSTKEVTQIHPKEMELLDYSLPLGERIYEPIEAGDQFVRGRVYYGWFKSLFTAESFDSYSGEYVLARLLNISPHIVWWHRLHPHYGAYIYYTAKDRYFPDFVAMDDSGIHWIIEGKDRRGRDDAKVQAKRKAAESLVQRLAIEPEYAGNTWGYMIAYEDDIAKAESWDDLKTLAQPVSNEV